MPFQTIRFNVMGDEQVARGFLATAAEVADMRVPLTAIGQILLRGVFEQFRTEGESGGSKWKPLSPAYEEWKRGMVGDEPILVFTGTMRAAMIAQNALRVDPRRLVYEPDSDIAGFHQKGVESRGLPQRQMVEIPEAERRLWDRAFISWLNDIRHGSL
jgi:hypothetical protein